eukprot:Tbor_TRINITY_DN6646_c0_g1::TRINITY_DN6646_c0_g1_i1::g.3112::m.3112
MKKNGNVHRCSSSQKSIIAVLTVTTILLLPMVIPLYDHSGNSDISDNNSNKHDNNNDNKHDNNNCHNINCRNSVMPIRYSVDPLWTDNIVMSAFYDPRWVVRNVPVSFSHNNTNNNNVKSNSSYQPRGARGPIISPSDIKPFYNGRDVPSLKWIEVFIRSLHAQISTDNEDIINNNINSDKVQMDTPRQIPRTRLVFFLDAYSYSKLAPRVSDLIAPYTTGSSPYSKTDNNNYLFTIEFVIVVPPEYREIYELRYNNYNNSNLHSIPPPTVVMPAYLSERWASSSLLRNAANNFRFEVYRDWLEEAGRRGEDYDKEGKFHANNNVNSGNIPSLPLAVVDLPSVRILLSDSTDVAFQRNPFFTAYDYNKTNSETLSLALPNSGCFPNIPRRLRESNINVNNNKVPIKDVNVIIYTLESSKKTFKNEVYNKRWLSCYGNTVLLAFARAAVPVSCDGMTLGNGVGIMTYLTELGVETRKPDLVNCSIKIQAALDQASHNYIMHKDRLFPSNGDNSRKRGNKEDPEYIHPVIIHHERDSCVFHGNFAKLNLVPDNKKKNGANKSGTHDIKEKPQDLVAVNPQGVPYAVVHQFSSDRHPPLMKILTERYLRDSSV